MSGQGSRVTIRNGGGHERDLGAITTLSVGYGLHQAWVYAAMFGTMSVFGLNAGTEDTGPSIVFVCSIFAYAVCLLMFALFDQRILRFMVERKTAVIAAVCMAVGTLLIVPSETPGALGMALSIASGVLTGIGSATLIAFWGVAFSRHSASTIIVNSALAIFVSMLVYAVILHLLPAPYSGICAALLPCIEVVLLWGQTPKSYVKRHEVPIFNPLPVKRVRFLALMGLPMLLFGLVLGFFRDQSIVLMMPRIDITAQGPFLLAAGLAAIIIVLAGFTIIDDDRASALLRPMLPIVALSIFFIPLSEANNTNVSWAVVVVTGYMCFEGLLWILMGTLVQRYRISPVLIFGIGRGAIAGGVLLAFSMTPFVDTIANTTIYNGATSIAIMLVALVAGFALMPHESDIKRAVTPAIEDGQTFADLLNIKEDEADEDDISAEEKLPRASSTEDIQDKHEQSEPANSMGTNEPATDEAPVRSGGLFRKKCERVANRYLLSAREAEVLFYLAKGHNAAFLQEKLFISEGTAKTHIRHIYGKTNVHNQQELMRLVADEWID